MTNLPYKIEDHVVASAAGDSSIFVRHFLKNSPKLHFLIVHGAVEHSGRHQDLVNFLLKSYSDVAVTVFDHSGHGRSGGPRSYIGSYEVWVKDLLTVGEFVQSKNNPETKTIICAHSLGGLITLTRILDTSYGWPFPLAGLILSAPCIRPKIMFKDISEFLLEKLDRVTPYLRLPMLYKGAHLTHDPQRANDFDTDSLIPKYMTVRMAKQIVDASSRIRGMSYYLKVPNLFLVAGQDYIVDPESTLLFAHGIDKQLTQIVEYPEGYHELWNETQRLEIFKTMKTWVDKLIKERP